MPMKSVFVLLQDNWLSKVTTFPCKRIVEMIEVCPQWIIPQSGLVNLIDSPELCTQWGEWDKVGEGNLPLLLKQINLNLSLDT